MRPDFSSYKHKAVFDFFSEINSIPRQSGNEKQISDYLKNFAEQRNLYVRQDEWNNVVIKKPGTKGYEDRSAVIIQGHSDMVCVKSNNSSHDFSKDPISMLIDGDFLKAKDTTLGADNGIAVAMSLALLDSENISHPPLEIVITTDEEVGLTGAMKMNTDDLTGKYFINLDSEEEGEFVVSCAGGVRLCITQNAEMTENNTEGCTVYRIEIKDLMGGHSGMEIDKKRGNSNRILGKVLLELDKYVSGIIKINGGVKDNVIPSYSAVEILVNNENIPVVEKLIENINDSVRNELGSADKDVKIIYNKLESISDKIKIISKKSYQDILLILVCSPNGIQTMSPEIQGLVQSSLNLGVIEHQDSIIKYIWALRSSVKSLKQHMINQMKLFADRLNTGIETWGDYPDWPLKPKSKLEQICVNTYKSMFKKEPVVKGIHAGLEGGVFLEKLPHLEAISLGPDMWEVHSINEKLSISSVERTYDLLISILQQLN
ncbi:MAG: aminoacyl-histidine dipeptidase [Spirochaetes bacterium]|nr:aminoacyl-histidine dipeptidase [Spirochaetota bacterium]